MPDMRLSHRVPHFKRGYVKMQKEHTKNELKKQMNDLFKSLDFVSKSYLNTEKIAKKTFHKFFNVYQQLGLAWEYLGLQCKHWDGYKKTKDSREVCKICGKVKGVDATHILLLTKGPKKLGKKVKPHSKKTFETKKEAEVINDTIDFHGAQVSVDVHNSYKSRVFGKGINIAAERIVRVIEENIECHIDRHLVHIRLRDHDEASAKNKYGSFPWEIKKKDLKHFPVIFDFDDQFRFLGLTILK